MCPHVGLNPWVTRRPAGLPTDSNPRAASVANGAPEIKIKSKARRPDSRPEWLEQKRFVAVRRRIAISLIHRDPNVGAGLPAKAVYQPPDTLAKPPLRGERACPALGCEAALNPAASVFLKNRGDLIGAATQPNAGQACSPHGHTIEPVAHAAAAAFVKSFVERQKANGWVKRGLLDSGQSAELQAT